MRRQFSGVLIAACLVGTLAVAGPALAGNVSARAAKTSCTTMGLSAASLRPYFGSVAVKAAGYECGLTGSDVSVTVYLYPLSEKVAVMKAYGAIGHAKRLGGLGAGAEYANDGSGQYRLFLTSGSHLAFIYAELLPSTGKLISLAHVIYRAMA